MDTNRDNGADLVEIGRQIEAAQLCEVDLYVLEMIIKNKRLEKQLERSGLWRAAPSAGDPGA